MHKYKVKSGSTEQSCGASERYWLNLDDTEMKFKSALTSFALATVVKIRSCWIRKSTKLRSRPHLYVQVSSCTRNAENKMHEVSIESGQPSQVVHTSFS
jgi:hypothetical protein